MENKRLDIHQIAITDATTGHTNTITGDYQHNPGIDFRNGREWLHRARARLFVYCRRSYTFLRDQWNRG